MDETDPVTIRILDAAAEEFGAHGFAGARVDEIAARANVNKATLYYRIGDKDRLYAAVFTRMIDEVAGKLREAIAREPDAEARIRTVARLVVRTAHQYPFFPPLILREVSSGGATLPDDVLRLIAEIFAIVAGVIEDGIAVGTFRRVDPVITHMLLVGSLLFLVSATPIRARIRQILPAGSAPREEPGEGYLVDRIAEIILHGISSSTQKTQRPGGRHVSKS